MELLFFLTCFANDSGEYAKLGLMAAAGLEDSTAEMSVIILGPAKGQEEQEEETQPQIYPLVTDDDVSEKQLRRCVAIVGTHRCPVNAFQGRFVVVHTFESLTRMPSQVRDRLPGRQDRAYWSSWKGQAWSQRCQDEGSPNASEWHPVAGASCQRRAVAGASCQRRAFTGASCQWRAFTGSDGLGRVLANSECGGFDAILS